MYDMTKEDAIKILEDFRGNPVLHTWEELDKALHVVIKALKAQEWIPVSKRLPEEKGEYFISYTYGVDIAEYNPTMYGDSIWSRDNILFKHNSVTAWREKPEPYKESGTE